MNFRKWLRMLSTTRGAPTFSCSPRARATSVYATCERPHSILTTRWRLSSRRARLSKTSLRRLYTRWVKRSLLQLATTIFSHGTIFQCSSGMYEIQTSPFRHSMWQTTWKRSFAMFTRMSVYLTNSIYKCHQIPDRCWPVATMGTLTFLTCRGTLTLPYRSTSWTSVAKHVESSALTRVNESLEASHLPNSLRLFRH